VLRLVGGNRSRAARLLGISRPTLLDRIRRYDLG
jgi:two-component system nitrogen regulation response regulator GlnG